MHIYLFFEIRTSCTAVWIGGILLRAESGYMYCTWRSKRESARDEHRFEVVSRPRRKDGSAGAAQNPSVESRAPERKKK